LRYLFLVGLLVSACTSSVVEQPKLDKSLKTIGQNTGLVADDGIYKAAFERRAHKACPDGYALIERTRTPSTLVYSGLDLDEHDFYWVIRCK
jgi:hypothetical protein